MVTIIKQFGNNEELKIPRIVTGLTSLDYSLSDNEGNIGVPLRSIIEVTGDQGIGKTSFAISLAGILASKQGRDILLIDFERQNEATLRGCLDVAGFPGNLEWRSYYADKKNSSTSEKVLNESTLEAYKNNPRIIVIDSLGAFTPTAVHEGDLGDSAMGRKAFVISQWFSRTLKPILENESPTSIIYTNHIKPVIGGMVRVFMPPKMESSGGRAVGYLSTQSFDLKPLYGYSFHEYGGWVLEGKIAKNRDGYGLESKRKFYVYLQAGEGIHPGLTAMFECVINEIASMSGKRITMDGTDYGKIASIIENRHNNPNFFDVFRNAIARFYSGNMDMEDKDGESSEEISEEFSDGVSDAAKKKSRKLKSE